MSKRAVELTEYKPPAYSVSVFNYLEPGLFLAGPIQGAPDWQAEAVDIISSVRRNKSLGIYNPRVSDFSGHTKQEQVAWEKKHLTRARHFGAILFWFAAQDHDLPYPEGRAYAQTSRIEFGRAMGWLDYELGEVQVLVGIQPGYQGGNEFYIRDCAAEFKMPVYDNLELLCRKAARVALAQ